MSQMFVGRVGKGALLESTRLKPDLGKPFGKREFKKRPANRPLLYKIQAPVTTTKDAEQLAQTLREDLTRSGAEISNFLRTLVSLHLCLLGLFYLHKAGVHL